MSDVANHARHSATMHRVTPTPRNTPLLAAHDLSFDARGQRLIDGITLEIAPLRSTIIMGANGSGKSLLLRLLHGLIAPAAGTVSWRGGLFDRSARREQAMVFQRPVMLRRSVAANLGFALSAHRVPRAERKAREAEMLALTRLEHLRDRPARVLSGGEQQRLAMARAMICTPRLLFLDEPTASLDPASTLAIEDLIAKARAKGTTIVMVTHDAGQARRLGDDLVFLSDGKVAEAGPVGQVLDAPKTEAAQAWLGGRLFVTGKSRQQDIM
tara:strand:+ start:6919 stop:7728 length:810 start_codon:yes stop_codon:yes gene_type:complete